MGYHSVHPLLIVCLPILPFHPSQLYTVDARLLKFHMLNPSKNVPVFFFLSEFSPIFELCPFD